MTGYISVFFFSSKWRHTSSYGDWSSDVCSSDLPRSPVASSRPKQPSRRSPTASAASRPASRRSEERRVGKECSAASLTQLTQCINNMKPRSGARKQKKKAIKQEYRRGGQELIGC